MESFNTVTDKNEAGLIFSQKHHLPAISFLEAHQSRIPKIRILDLVKLSKRGFFNFKKTVLDSSFGFP